MERVAIIADNSADYAELVIELWNKGAVPVLIDFRIPAMVCLALVDIADAKIIYTDSRELDQYIVKNRKDLNSRLMKNQGDMISILSDKVRMLYQKRYDDSEALILFSSGTTGKNKGIRLSHKAITLNAEMIAERKGVDNTSTLYMYKTFSHCASFMGELMLSFVTGSILYISSAKNIMRKHITNINKYGITHFSVNPSILQIIIKSEKKDYRFGSLRLISCSGSLLVDSCRQKAQVFFGCPVINMYGMTETSALVACQEPVLVDYIDRDGRPESTGIPLNGVTVKIMKYDQKKEAEPGETGLVLIATPTIMLGYIGQEIELQQGGYWNTGDIGYVDENGELYVVGRYDRMLISCGHNVFPESIEHLIKSNNLVYDCLINGIENTVYGQEIACFYSCDEKDKESVECKIQELCSMSLAQYEIPHYFIWREKFNYTASGKLIITNAL